MEDIKPLKKRGNFLLRQELKNLTLEITPLCSFIFNLSIAVLFIIITIPMNKSVSKFQEYSTEYTNCSLGLNTSYCNITLNIEQDINDTAYIYYEIWDFYINDKEFVGSRDFYEYNDYTKSNSTSSKCNGASIISEVIDDGNYTSIGGYKLSGSSLAYPCGFVAKYHFNDTFQLYDSQKNEIEIDETNIAYPEYKGLIYRNLDNKLEVQWKDVEDEHYIVWMSTEADSNFIKPWGRFNSTLYKGNYTVIVKNSKYFINFNI